MGLGLVPGPIQAKFCSLQVRPFLRMSVVPQLGFKRAEVLATSTSTSLKHEILNLSTLHPKALNLKNPSPSKPSLFILLFDEPAESPPDDPIQRELRAFFTRLLVSMLDSSLQQALLFHLNLGRGLSSKPTQDSAHMLRLILFLYPAQTSL